MITPMLRPDLFGALATHAGDALYDSATCRSSPKAARLLRDLRRRHRGACWADFRGRIAGHQARRRRAARAVGYAACFSADEDGTVRLPFDDARATWSPEVWERWLALGPGADGRTRVRRRAARR